MLLCTSGQPVPGNRMGVFLTCFSLFFLPGLQGDILVPKKGRMQHLSSVFIASCFIALEDFCVFKRALRSLPEITGGLIRDYGKPFQDKNRKRDNCQGTVWGVKEFTQKRGGYQVWEESRTESEGRVLEFQKEIPLHSLLVCSYWALQNSLKCYSL